MNKTQVITAYENYIINALRSVYTDMWIGKTIPDNIITEYSYLFDEENYGNDVGFNIIATKNNKFTFIKCINSDVINKADLNGFYSSIINSYDRNNNYVLCYSGVLSNNIKQVSPNFQENVMFININFDSKIRSNSKSRKEILNKFTQLGSDVECHESNKKEDINDIVLNSKEKSEQSSLTFINYVKNYSKVSKDLIDTFFENINDIDYSACQKYSEIMGPSFYECLENPIAVKNFTISLEKVATMLSTRKTDLKETLVNTYKIDEDYVDIKAPPSKKAGGGSQKRCIYNAKMLQTISDGK